MKRIVRVDFYKLDGSYDSQLKLETSKLDNIGFTKESLDEYLKIFLFDGNGEQVKRASVISDRTYKK